MEMYHNKMNNYNGIVNYISKYHQELVLKGKKEHAQHNNHYHKIIRAFLRDQGIEHKKSNHTGNIFFNANKAQKKWSEFKKFLKTYEH